MMCVSVPFSKLHEHACDNVPIVLVVGTKECLQTNYGDVVHCCTKFHVCQLFISTWKTLIYIAH